MGKAFIEDYKGVIGFEVEKLGTQEDLQHYTNGITDVYPAIRDIGARLDALGWAPSNAGNISIRHIPHHHAFFITASGSEFGNLKPDDIVEVHGAALVVKDKKLYVGSNFGVDGEMRASRFVEVMREQGLLDDMLDKFGIKELRSKMGEYDFVRHGRELINKLGLSSVAWQFPYSSGLIKETDERMMEPITPEALLTEKYCEILRKRHGLSDYDVECLWFARNCESIGAHRLHASDVDSSDRLLARVGLSVKNIVEHLGKKGLLKCKVWATAGREPSSETLLHANIYASRWEDDDNVNAIVHCHAPGPTSNPPGEVAITETDQKIIGYGTLELAVEAVEALRRRDCVMLKGHGPVAVTSAWTDCVGVDGKFCFDSSFVPVFEDAFGVLQKVDELSQSKTLWDKVAGLFG